MLASGVTRVGIRGTDLNKVTILRPPLDEQRTIADFLDYETAQIDTLVAKQEEFIAFLKERRAGIIASGVAGLEIGDAVEPDDTWIGACPSGWVRGQVKHFGSVTLGKMLHRAVAATLIGAKTTHRAKPRPHRTPRQRWTPRQRRGGIDGVGAAGAADGSFRYISQLEAEVWQQVHDAFAETWLGSGASWFRSSGHRC